MKSRSLNDFSLKNNPMILNNGRPGYDPDQYDDEPSDYVNSETAYDADDLSRDTAEEFDTDQDDDDLDESDDDVEDDSDVDEDDLINDDVSDYRSSDPAAFHHEGKKPVYIKDMPYIDHATPGVTSH